MIGTGVCGPVGINLADQTEFIVQTHHSIIKHAFWLGTPPSFPFVSMFLVASADLNDLPKEIVPTGLNACVCACCKPTPVNQQVPEDRIRTTTASDSCFSYSDMRGNKCKRSDDSHSNEKSGKYLSLKYTSELNKANCAWSL